MLIIVGQEGEIFALNFSSCRNVERYVWDRSKTIEQWRLDKFPRRDAMVAAPFDREAFITR